MIDLGKLTRFVSRNVQARGLEYFASRRVEILDGDARTVHALVHGTLEYQVSIAREADTLLAACSCPYFGSSLNICKHIWATLLAAREGRLLLGQPGSNRTELRLEPIPPQDAGLITETFDIAAGLPAWRPWQPPPQAAMRRRRGDRWTEFALALDDTYSSEQSRFNPPQQVVYIVDADATSETETLVLELAGRDRKTNGEWGKPRSLKLTVQDVHRFPDAVDRRLIERLFGAREYTAYGHGFVHRMWIAPSGPVIMRLSPALVSDLMPLMAATGRLFVRRMDATGHAAVSDLGWDNGAPWRFALDITPVGAGYAIDGAFFRDGDRMSVRDPAVVSADGIVLARGCLARADDRDARRWIRELRTAGPLRVASDASTSLIEAVCKSGVTVNAWPEDLRYEVRAVQPRPRLLVRKGDAYVPQGRLRAALSFLYGDAVIDEQASARVMVDHQTRTILRRDGDAEAASRQRLIEAGFRLLPHTDERNGRFEIAEGRFATALHGLVHEGWRVEAEGRIYRAPRALDICVASGIDWFELQGAAHFDDREVPLPDLLAAIKRGRHYIELGDGSFGMLPEEWLRQYGSIAALAHTEGDRVRFSPGQVGLLDALLAEQPAVSWDEGFARAREAFSRFAGITPLDPPASFAGTLRQYQREGLGWLEFLRQSGFGGCLADDMGLGKTVMVLALLERIRVEGTGGGERRPSLIVVPRSLVFNWIREAERFTPLLRLADYTGAARASLAAQFADHDVVITTYGTLRRDAARLKDLPFEYVVLDEAQAIKNASTASAKAVRLLQARHRLALSGTPIENHLGELWSLFEFLNRGLLGTASVFQRLAAGRTDSETLALIARGLKPLVLRRTKEQVVTDLPPKVEQTIYCELDAAQRTVYDELKRHYQRALMARIARDGIEKSQVQILEALLRLRQAACHPALIDRTRGAEPSAKLDVLLSRIEESREEQHKALVFSQFTSFLAIVRQRLDAAGIAYQYLDGETRDRGARVERFQSDPSCRLFLVSLKAGGLGLNLTAADHVFLLDPWWNPAAEAQAIDRAHRIGQSQRVFAFRLIARDTVEERVLELQTTKRALADAILGEGADLARTLSRDDLELLLS